MAETIIRVATEADRPAVDAILTASWGRPFVVLGGNGVDLTGQPALVALIGDEIVGALVYRVDGDALEVLSVNSRAGGAGTGMITAARDHALALGLRRLWLVTTNNNSSALRFYQRNGLHLVGVRTGAVSAARKIKPTIPRNDHDGHAIDDELVLELRLDGVDDPYGEPGNAAAVALSRLLTWRGGETDLWPLLADPRATVDVVRGLSRPFLGAVDLVLGPDPGGMLFGPLAARELEVPFAPVCRDRRFFFQGPHERVTVQAGADELHAHRAALADGARVLLVDDWSESGSTVRGVADLVAQTGATLAGVSYLVDSLRPEVRADLEARGIEVRGLVTPAGLRD
ncbi:GNAT family N-acetyltransferase [Phytomonospora sp. NPDC050363]|uniref:GNAT family N-acetyltransferase n=1 Tax=Phytomonospora sp. NPDC050363 TaxID=3155642 RepID=UPI00340C91DD